MRLTLNEEQLRIFIDALSKLKNTAIGKFYSAEIEKLLKVLRREKPDPISAYLKGFCPKCFVGLKYDTSCFCPCCKEEWNDSKVLKIFC